MNDLTECRTLGEFLHHARRRAKVKADDLSAIGVARSSVYTYERDEYRPRPDRFARMLDYYGVTDGNEELHGWQLLGSSESAT
jgi:transcriptional regulator with XRE-family HTH domain